VFADGSAVENSRTAVARGDEIRNATTSMAKENVRRSTGDIGVVIRKDRSVWIIRPPDIAGFLPKVMKTKNRRRRAQFVGNPRRRNSCAQDAPPFSFESLLR
jgi:hypothetical protein